MSAEQIGRRARRVQWKARGRAILSVAIGVGLFFWFGRLLIRTPDLIPRIGLATIILWSIYVAVQAFRGNWPANMPKGGQIDPSIDYLRHELQRRLDYTRQSRTLAFAICFTGMGLVIGPALYRALMTDPHLLLKATPFFTLLAIWAVAYLFLKKHIPRKIQRDLDELNALQRGE